MSTKRKDSKASTSDDSVRASRARSGYENLAASVLYRAVEDSAIVAWRPDCYRFLDSNEFKLFCAILDLDPDRAKVRLVKRYKTKAKTPKKEFVYMRRCDYD